MNRVVKDALLTCERCPFTHQKGTFYIAKHALLECKRACFVLYTTIFYYIMSSSHPARYSCLPIESRTSDAVFCNVTACSFVSYNLWKKPINRHFSINALSFHIFFILLTPEKKYILCDKLSNISQMMTSTS